MPRAVQGEAAAARAGAQERGSRLSTGFSAAFPLAAHALTLQVEPDLPGPRVQTSAATETSAKRLLPALLPQPKQFHPSSPQDQGAPRLAAKHLLHLGSGLPASEQADRHRDKASAAGLLPAGHGAGEKPAEGREMPRPPTHTHTQPQSSLVTHPTEISRSDAPGGTAQTSEHAGACGARQLERQRRVQRTLPRLARLCPQLDKG